MIIALPDILFCSRCEKPSKIETSQFMSFLASKVLFRILIEDGAQTKRTQRSTMVRRWILQNNQKIDDDLQS